MRPATYYNSGSNLRIKFAVSVQFCEKLQDGFVAAESEQYFIDLEGDDSSSVEDLEEACHSIASKMYFEAHKELSSKDGKLTVSRIQSETASEEELSNILYKILEDGRDKAAEFLGEEAKLDDYIVFDQDFTGWGD